MSRIHFGVTLPQIKRPWEDTQAAAIELDHLGFHSVWFNDHLYGMPMPQLPILEAWTALAADPTAAVRRNRMTVARPSAPGAGSLKPPSVATPSSSLFPR